MNTPMPETLQFIAELGYNGLRPETQQEANRIIENLTGCIDRACSATYTGWRFAPEPVRRQVMLAVKCSMLYHKLNNDLDYTISELEDVIKSSISEQNYRSLGYIRGSQQVVPNTDIPVTPRKRRSINGCFLLFILLILAVIVIGGSLYFFTPSLVKGLIHQIAFSNPDDLVASTPAPTSTPTPTPTPRPPTPTPFPTATPLPTPVPTPDWRARAQDLYWEYKNQFNGPKTDDIVRVKTTVGKEVTGKVIRISPKVLELRTRDGEEKFLNTQIVKEQRLKLFSYDYAMHMAKKQLRKERKAFVEYSTPSVDRHP